MKAKSWVLSLLRRQIRELAHPERCVTKVHVPLRFTVTRQSISLDLSDRGDAGLFDREKGGAMMRITRNYRALHRPG